MAIQLEEGKYLVRMQALKKDEDEASAMGPYLGENAILTLQDGKTYITLMLMEQDVIKNFELLAEKAVIPKIDSQINEELNSRYEMFELPELEKELLARVQYELEYEGREIKGDEQLRLLLEEDSIQNVEEISE